MNSINRFQDIGCEPVVDWNGVPRNARFPLGPSALAFALNTGGSILVGTGPALRDLAGREQQDKGDQLGARLRPGTEWFVTGQTREQELFEIEIIQGNPWLKPMGPG